MRHHLVSRAKQWPLWTHSQMILGGLKGRASVAQIAAIQAASQKFDNGSSPLGNTQTQARAYMHSMRSPVQSPNEAARQTSQFVDGMIGRAQSALKSGDEAEALTYAGIAMHAQMDATSPAHATATGSPKAWRGMNPLSIGHSREILSGPAPEQRARSAAMLRQTWDRIFGAPE